MHILGTRKGVFSKIAVLWGKGNDLFDDFRKWRPQLKENRTKKDEENVSRLLGETTRRKRTYECIIVKGIVIVIAMAEGVPHYAIPLTLAATSTTLLMETRSAKKK